MKEWISKISKKGKGTDKDKQESNASQDSTDQFTDNFNLNLEMVRQEIGHNWDVHFREFNLGRTGIRSVILFLVVALMSLKIFEIDNLRPVLGEGVIPVLKGVKTTALAFTGPEIMLVLLPFMNSPKKAVKALLVGVSIPLIFYVITVVMVIGALSIDGVVTRTWPTLDLLRSFEISGLIFERFESLLLAIWIMQIFSIFTITYYAAALGLAQLSKKSIHPFMFGLLPILYIIAMVPKNINDLFKLGDFIGNVALFLFGLLPLLLLIISRVKGGKYETNT